MNQKKLIIIPAYNEAKSIRKVISDIRETESLIDVVVIDDCSHDGTAEIANDMGVAVISLSTNLGYGGALQTGYKYAILNGYQIIVQMDGDGQHDPRYLSSLISVVENDGIDVAIGSRFLGNLRQYKVDPLRQLGMAFFRFLIFLIIKKRITDPTSGYQAINDKVAKFFTIENLFPSDYPDADMVILLHNAGFKVKEVPVVMYENETGKSMHSGFKPVYYIVKLLLSIFAVSCGEYRKFLRRQKSCIGKQKLSSCY